MSALEIEGGFAKNHDVLDLLSVSEKFCEVKSTMVLYRLEPFFVIDYLSRYRNMLVSLLTVRRIHTPTTRDGTSERLGGSVFVLVL